MPHVKTPLQVPQVLTQLCMVPQAGGVLSADQMNDEPVAFAQPGLNPVVTQSYPYAGAPHEKAWVHPVKPVVYCSSGAPLQL